MEESEVFVRKATGVVREVSAIEALLSNIALLQIGLPGFYVYLTAWLFPGWDVPTVFLLTLIPVTAHAVLLSIMSSQFPRSGSVYVWLSRILPPYIVPAFVFGSVIIGATLPASFMDWAVYGGVGSITTSLGLALNNPGLAEITTTLLDPNVRFAIVTLICAVFAISSIVSPKWTRRWISLTAIIGIIAGLTAGLSLLFASHETFVSNWNSHFGSYLTYDQVISTAEGGGYAYVPIGLGTFGALFGLIAATYEMNIGYEASTAFAGEIKSARRSIPFATLGCLYIGAVILFLMAWGQGNIIGQKFVYSSMYLFNARPDLWTVPAAADPFLYAVMATGLNPVLAVIIPLALLISPLGLIPIAYYTNSRNLLAFSFDRWLPGTLSKVSKKYHTPWVAILFTFVLYEIGAAFSAYYAAGVIYLSLPMRSLMLLWISVSAIAALIFPLVRKDLYERSDLVKKNRGKLALSSIVAAGFFLFSCVYVLIHPEYGGPPNLTTWILVIGLIISGPIIWQIARVYWARKGLDISLVYKEIPPE